MSFSFAQITDHHLLPQADALLHGFSPGHSFRKTLHFIAENLARKIDFVVSSGDLVETADAASYATAVEMLKLEPGAKAGEPGRANGEGLKNMPIYFLPGNHDDRRNFYQHVRPGHQAGELANMVFEHSGVRFVCLDFGAETKGFVSDDTLNFLKQNLSDQPAILLLHHPVVKIGAKWLDSFLAEDLGGFWDLVAGKQVLATLSGHVHISYEQRVNDIVVLGTRSTAYPFALQDEPLMCLLPPQVRLVTVDGNSLSTQLIEVPLN